MRRVMVSKRGRGRPKKEEDVPVLQNPNRFYVAWLGMSLEVMPPPPSIRRASKLIAAIMFGNEVDTESLSPEVRDIFESWRAKMIMAHGPGKILPIGPIGPVVHKADGSVSYKNTKRGVKAATVENASEYIRKLYRQAMKEAETNPDVARWLRCAVKGCILAAHGAPAALVAEIFRNSGDPELEADTAVIIRLNKSVS
jgi:hypothetical protein